MIKIDLHRALEVLSTELACVQRECDRDCANCDLVMDTKDIVSAYNETIEVLRDLVPVKPIVGGNKFYCGGCVKRLPTKRGKRKPYCPACGRPVKWE